MSKQDHPAQGRKDGGALAPLPFLTLPPTPADRDLPAPAVSVWEVGNPGTLREVSHPYRDIYQLLDALGEVLAPQGDTLGGVLVLTSGWAAPLGDDGQVEGAPSAHPERRRVFVTCSVARDGSQAARMEFAGGDGDTVTDDNGTGSLAFALDSLGFGVWGAEFVRGMTRAYRDALRGDDDGRVRSVVADRIHALVTTETDTETTGDALARLTDALGAFLGGEGWES